jgi:putative flippase GtrA
MKLGRFGIVSGVGWLLDFSLFTLLSWRLLSPAPANAVSALVAVVFVFIASTRKVFYEGTGFSWGKLVAYLAYQAVIIALFSFAIQALTRWSGLPPPVCKVLVTPVNFYTNFLFMSVLLTGRVRFY